MTPDTLLANVAHKYSRDYSDLLGVYFLEIVPKYAPEAVARFGHLESAEKEEAMRAIIIALVAWLFLGISLSWADMVELKTGQRVEGTFKQATAGGVTIEVAGQTITFDQEKVRAIYFGSSPAPGQPAAQPAL